MKPIIEVSLKLGILFGLSSAIAFGGTRSVISVSAQTESGNTNNQMAELSSQWGFQVTSCQEENVAQVEHDVTGDTVCLVPNDQLGVGKFIYDSANNQIRPLNSPQVSQSDNVSTDDSEAEYVNPVPQTKDPRIAQVKFSFDNSYDYGACLDAILLAYEQREQELENTSKNQCAKNIFSVFGNKLSKDITLQLIDSANLHATKVLEDKLYPSLGLRRRVAINTGYVYDIDRQNEDILKYVTANPE